MPSAMLANEYNNVKFWRVFFLFLNLEHLTFVPGEVLNGLNRWQGETIRCSVISTCILNE